MNHRQVLAIVDSVDRLHIQLLSIPSMVIETVRSTASNASLGYIHLSAIRLPECGPEYGLEYGLGTSRTFRLPALRRISNEELCLTMLMMMKMSGSLGNASCDRYPGRAT